MKGIRPVGSRKHAPESHYVLTAFFGVIITADLSMIIGFTMAVRRLERGWPRPSLPRD